jgi:radical SAM superfamily enzyme
MHVPVAVKCTGKDGKKRRGSCVYCSAIYSAKKARGEVTGRWDKFVRRTTIVCFFHYQAQ